MKLKIENIKENPVTLMRRAGYVFQRKDGDSMSFVRELGRSGYPRFHVYLSTEGVSMNVNLHLDQKKETYGNETRHHGEYEDSRVVQEEMDRIKPLLG